MKSILHSMYDGEVFPSELIMPQDPELHILYEKLSEEKAYFKQKLSEGDYERLEEFDSLYSRTDSIYSRASFLYGFRLGAMLMVEVFTEKEELVRGGNK